MPRLWSAATCLIASIWCGNALASDRPSPVLTPYFFVSELRGGLNAHDLDGVEKDSVALTGEVLFARPTRFSQPLLDLLVPRIHLGASLNSAGDTSYGYAGFTWNVDITPQIFIEVAFGGAVHNGDTGPLVPRGQAALGCSPLFREAAAIGWRFSRSWNVSIGIEHLSNAGLCDRNRGLTNAGVKLGYAF